ncbi:MAG TPA: hypothetical protein VGM03_23125 [Phycisphaerae bacterium]
MTLPDPCTLDQVERRGGQVLKLLESATTRRRRGKKLAVAR